MEGTVYASCLCVGEHVKTSTRAGAYTFKPCLIASSVKISNVLNVTLISRSAATTLALKPQRGASGVPFMHRRTSADDSKAFSRATLLPAAAAGSAGIETALALPAGS